MRSLVLLALCHCSLAAIKAASTSTTEQTCNITVADQKDLVRWSLASKLTYPRDSHATAVFANKVWIIGGVSASYYTKRLTYTSTRSDVIYSSDGVTWEEALEEAPFRRRYGHSLTSFTDTSDNVERLVLLGGFAPEPATDLWVSLDGALWTETTAAVPWTGRGFHCALVFDRKLWVLGGSPLNNEVWSTSSVLEGPWYQQPHVPWSPRAAHACAVHEVMTNATAGDVTRVKSLFLMGGWRETSLHDVWRMDADGRWTLLVDAAPWEARAWFSLVSFDSRTSGDVQLGPRLWVLGGGLVGKGVEKMYPFSDAWYTRNGLEWTAASSSATGISTAEWSLVDQSNAQVCLGKWGHSVVPWNRTVSRAYYCHESCRNEAGTISLASQAIPVCNPTDSLPEQPAQRTLLVNQSLITKTIYPDGCGLCNTDPNARYQNSTSVPTLLFVAGNAGVQKVNDVFQSSDGMLCEREGIICSNAGVCVQGGSCLCDTGKAGVYCESELSYTIIESTNCFPESAPVVVAGDKMKRLGDVEIGDAVLSMDKDGKPVYSTVYYIPHESHRTQEIEYIRVSLESMDHHEKSTDTLHVTPDHLVFYFQESTSAFEKTRRNHGRTSHGLVHVPMAKLAQKPASALQVHDVLLTLTSQFQSCLMARRARTRLPTTVSSSKYANCRAHDVEGKLDWQRVTGLTRVTHRSAKTVYTMTGNFFVAGVLCSNFGDYYPTWPRQQWRDQIAFALFAPHRMVYTLVPSPRTATLLRVLMDQLVLPMLRWWGRLFFFSHQEASASGHDCE